MSSIRQEVVPRVKTSPTRDSYTISSSSSPTRPPPFLGSAPARKTPKSPRSGMVPPEVTASRCAPGRPVTVPATRSQTTRGRSSAKASEGYRPASMSSTASNADSGSEAKGAARRTSASSSSVGQVSSAVMATSCCASTSSGLAGTRSDSIAPSRIRSVTTAACTRSPRYLGKTTPVETAPTWWPARPTRWRPEATDGGDSTWTTRSTAPMSMPSSRLDVATTAGSLPALRSSSTWARCSLETEPWWARASSGGAPSAAPDWAMISAGEPCGGGVAAGPPVGPGGRGASKAVPVARSYAISLSRLHSRSARRRELAKTMVERWAWTRSAIRSSTCGQIEGRSPSPRSPEASAAGAPPSSPRSSTGTTTERSNSFADGGWTISTLRCGER